MKLCIFSDIHYIDEIPNWEVKRKLVEYADRLTEKMIDKINNEIKPDVSVCLGDMIQASSNLEKDKRNIEYIYNKLKRINNPFYTLLGNHELKLVKSNREILDLIGYDSATYSVDIEGYHLLFIGTDINEEDKKNRTQYISDEDLEWIEKDLELNKDKKVIIFSHFGIPEDKKLMDNFWAYTEDGENLMLRNRDKLKELIKNKNVLAVFIGHLHWTKKIKEDGIDYYMLGSLTENINNDGKPDGVYFEVDVDDNNIRVQEKHLELDKKIRGRDYEK